MHWAIKLQDSVSKSKYFIISIAVIIFACSTTPSSHSLTFILVSQHPPFLACCIIYQCTRTKWLLWFSQSVTLTVFYIWSLSPMLMSQQPIFYPYCIIHKCMYTYVFHICTFLPTLWVSYFILTVFDFNLQLVYDNTYG